MAFLKTKSAGAGIFVFPPVAQPGLSPDFSTGCARWLTLYIGGDLTMTQTPAWYQATQTMFELGRDNLRLKPDEAPAAVQILGVPYYALGTAEPGKITFQVYDRSGKAVGDPVTLSGDDAALLAALPDAANTLRNRMGLARANFPPPAESPADMAVAGRVPLIPGNHITDADAAVLQNLSEKSLLSGLLYKDVLARAQRNPGGVAIRVARLSNAAAENAIVLNEIAHSYPSVETMTRVQGLYGAHPQHPLLAEAFVYQNANIPQRVTAAEDCVRSAPEQPNHWLLLAAQLRFAADDIRRARTVEQVDPDEWTRLNTFYAKALAVAREAFRLDPKSAAGALELATAATFAGEDAEARKALEAAFQSPSRQTMLGRIVGWALEMNAPKWGGSRERLQQAADRAAALPPKDIPESVNVLNTLLSHGYLRQAERLAGAILGEAKRQLPTATEGEAVAIFECQYRAFLVLRRPAEALAAVKRMLDVRPRDTEGLYLIVEAYQAAGNPKEALARARKLEERFPEYYKTQKMLADLLVAQKKYDEAIQPAQMAADMVPGSHKDQEMAGWLLGNADRNQEAVPYLEKALSLAPSLDAYRFNLGEALCRTGQVERGREMVEAAMTRSGDPEIVAAGRKLLKEFPAGKK